MPELINRTTKGCFLQINAKAVLVLLLTFLFSYNNLLIAQNLSSSKAEGSSSSTSFDYEQVSGATINIDVTNVDKLLVVSTFSSKTNNVASTGSYRIVDNSDSESINSDVFQLTHSGKDGIGTVLGCFFKTS
ncbi:MAG: hypothetical protein JXR58_07080 [Bacteroidales bacterium]|nr:hypothetical protein [Bacteroidales bacterium]